MKRAYTNANIVDVERHALVEGVTLVAEEDRILGIGAEPAPDAAERIDLQGRYVVPGLFNCHTHMNFAYGNASFSEARSVAWHTIIGIRSLEDYIETGCTFVREVGDYGFITVDLRDAVRQGWIRRAPDIQTCGRPITMTGGSMWIRGIGYEADGVDECRKAARFMLRNRVDWVKIMATGGTCTLGNKCGTPQLDEAEIAAAVREAHKAGKKVSCHAQGIEGAKNAVRAGADSIEHGFELDDECIAMMAERGTWLVPTLCASYEIMQRADGGTHPEFVAKAKNNVANVFRSFPKAYRAGVKCAAGTDCGSVLNPHTNTCEELILMVEKAGLTPGEALEVGTLNSAKLCGVDDVMGSLVPGKKANFAVYAENPLEDITALRHCAMTVKNGEALFVAPTFGGVTRA